MSKAFSIDARAFSRKLNKLKLLTRKNAAEIVRSEVKLFVKDVIKLTPPFGKAPSTESLNAQRKVGEEAVRRDIGRTMQPIQNLDMVNKPTNEKLGTRINNWIRRRKTAELEKVLRDSGIANAKVVAEAEGDIHERARASRGRVRRKVDPTFVLRRPTLNRYTREKVSHVGKGKAGWVRAARALGVRVPGWISRHNAPGQFIDATRGPKPSITVANLVEHVQESGAELRIIQRALASRVQTMRKKIERILSKGKR